MANKTSEATNVMKKIKIDFGSDQDVRWCPGCGDYAILAQMKKVLADLDTPREKTVFISGIGCSSRFPYYINSYGFHTIHGRAPTLATGLKIANPDLSVWIITGDGDGLSIGGNHLMHLCRRNLNVNIILFNNQIYGLTKGQYSPTSPIGKVTKTTPFGSLDTPFNPLSLVLSARASFVARTIDRDTKHMASIFKRAAAHKGTSFVEVYQNCNIYNDGAFAALTDPASKLENVLYLEEGQPMIYGKEKDKGIQLNGLSLEKTAVNGNQDDLLVHAENSGNAAYPQLLAQMSEDPELPTPIGVIHRAEREIYEETFYDQMDSVTKKQGKGNLKQLFITGDTWKVD